jgi:hypothetical protein
MTGAWQLPYRGLTCPIGVFACLLLAVPAETVAGDALSGEARTLSTAPPRGIASIPALVARLEWLIATNYQATAGKDDQAGTIADMLLLLPNAPPPDAKLVLEIPTRFAARAREAEAAGRDDEAARFAALADVLGDLLSGKASNGAAGPQPAAPSFALGGPTTAPAPVPPSTDGLNLTSRPGAQVGLAPSTSPPVATPSMPNDSGAAAGAERNEALQATIRPHGLPRVAALLAKLEQQIASDYEGPLASDDQADTIADILLLLPSAPPSDAKLVLATPAHLANRARDAEAAGRHNQASRFAALADVLEGLLGGNTGPSDAAVQETPRQPGVESPPAVTWGNPAIATAPVTGGADGVHYASNGNPTVGVAALMSPPEPTDIGSQLPPAGLASPSNDDRSGAAEATVAVDAPNRQPPDHSAVERSGSGSVGTLLAKLEQQIASDPRPTLGESDTIADVLLLLPSASPGDAKLALDAPAHFADRAREAENAGRHDEAGRFATLADVFGGLLRGRARDERPETPPQPDAAPPSTREWATAGVPVAPPGDANSVNPATRGNTLALVAAAQAAPSLAAPSMAVPITSRPSPPVATTSEPSTEPARRGGDDHSAAIHPRMESEPKPAGAMPSPPPSPPDAAKSTAPAKQAETRLPPTETARPPPVPEQLRVARLTDSGATANFSGTVSPSEPAGRQRTAYKVPAGPAARASRIAGPTGTSVSTATTTTADPQCRAILQKFSLGEDPSDAERSYLRNGCRHG